MKKKISLQEQIVRVLLERYKSTNTFAPFIRQTLQSIYQPLGLWGHAPNPHDDCETGLGVINVFPHSEHDSWSILNRFDTNRKVEEKIREYFSLSKPKDTSDSAFRKWIEDNKNDLFGPKGKYTHKLVDINLGTVISGNRREEQAVKILTDRFPDANRVKRYCSGDIRDTRKGIDITVEHPKKNFNVQVKGFKKVASYVEPDGDTFFEVTSDLTISKYSERNVDVFMFVNIDTSQYILFKNKKNKMSQMRSDIVRFYEPPLYTNMSFQTTQKRKMKDFEETDKLFGVETNLLKNLEFRRDQIQKMIDKIKNSISK